MSEFEQEGPHQDESLAVGKELILGSESGIDGLGSEGVSGIQEVSLSDSAPQVEKPGIIDKLKDFGINAIERQSERAREVAHRFGKIGVMAALTLKSPDRSMQEKGKGLLAAGVDGVAEVLDVYFKFLTPMGALNPYMSERFGKPLDAFTEGFVDAAAAPLIGKSEEDGYSLSEAGVINYVNPEGLIATAVGSTVEGVGSALRTSAQYEKERDPGSKAAKVMGYAQKGFDSPIGRKVTEAVSLATTQKINAKLK